MSEQPYLQTLGNGLRVLEVLRDGPCTLAELMNVTGLPRLTAYRIVRTLEFHRMVSRDPDTGRIRIALRLWEFSRAALAEGRGPLITAEAEGLRDRWGDTVHVAVYERGEVMYINKVDGTMPLRSYTELGGRAPARSVATGKSLLAFQPPEEIERVLSGRLAPLTERSITTKREMRRELGEIRSAVSAVNRGEWRAEIGGIASPILTMAGRPVAAIGLSGPVQRILDGDREARAREVLRSAARIAASLSPEADVGAVWARYRIEPEPEAVEAGG